MSYREAERMAERAAWFGRHVVRHLRGRVCGRVAQGVGSRFRAEVFQLDRRRPKTTPDP
jgi:hypothetical protein